MNTKTAMNSNSRTGRRDDREFKNNTVALVRGVRTVMAVARDLGVSTGSLGRWVEQAKTGQALSEPKSLSVESAEPFRQAPAEGLSLSNGKALSPPKGRASCAGCGRRSSMSAASATS